jgi:hypothetical protein
MKVFKGLFLRSTDKILRTNKSLFNSIKVQLRKDYIRKISDKYYEKFKIKRA